MEQKRSDETRKYWKRFACLVMLCCVMALVSGEPPAAAAPPLFLSLLLFYNSPLLIARHRGTVPLFAPGAYNDLGEYFSPVRRQTQA